MSTKLVEEENTIYEVDEDCMKEKEKLPELEDLVATQEACRYRKECENCGGNRRRKGNNNWCLLLLCLCILCR